jgi:DNA mismatch endonuclease (patch repair protein)
MLHRRRLRFRKDFPIPLAGRRAVRVDIAFTRIKLAIFVDGCFWHQCPLHGSMPKANAAYWVPKLEGNVFRDRKDEAALAVAGWRVLRVWEHDVGGEAAERIWITALPMRA